MEGLSEMTNTRRSGWSGDETRLLWETADEAQQQGMPLKAVFERIARETGRRPNSIRNYYYAQVAKREGGSAHTARFVPFTEPEVARLMEQVLRDRAQVFRAQRLQVGKRLHHHAEVAMERFHL